MEKNRAKSMLIPRDNSWEVSETPKVANRRPLIIQYSGFIMEIFLQKSGSISIDQNTPPRKISGIKKKFVMTMMLSHVLAKIPTMTPAPANAQETVMR